MNADKPLHCTCCGKRQREVESLIAPARNGLICNECVELLHDIEQKKTGDPVILRNRASNRKNSSEYTPTSPECAKTRPAPRLDRTSAQNHQRRV